MISHSSKSVTFFAFASIIAISGCGGGNGSSSANTADSSDSGFENSSEITTAATSDSPEPAPTDRGSVSGDTYYVSTQGSDSASGSQGQPFKTLSRAMNVLSPGDVLLVGPGTYPESLYASIPSGTSWSSAVTIRAQDPANRPLLRPSSGGRVLHFQDQQYIIIDGLILDGANVSIDTVKLTKSSTHHIRLENSVVRNAPEQGILTTNGASNLEFINLDVYDNGSSDFDHGLYISSGLNLIDGCRVYRNAGWGVHVYNGAGTASDNVVRNNHVFDNASLGDRGDGILLSSGDGNVAYNNVVYGNHIGIRVDYGATGSTVAFNTVSLTHGSYGGIFVSRATGTVVRNNIVWQNSSDQIEDRGSGTYVQDNLVGIDPRFVSFGDRDFRLTAASPAVDSAVPVSGINTDIDRVSRPQYGAPDIGAHEFK